MAMMLFMGIINTLIFLRLMIGLIYLFVLIIKSLRKYLKSSDIRNEKTALKSRWVNASKSIEPDAT